MCLKKGADPQRKRNDGTTETRHFIEMIVDVSYFLSIDIVIIEEVFSGFNERIDYICLH